jgi:hypothetical protein
MEVKHIMVEIIGAILLLYGVIGLIGLVVAYGTTTASRAARSG